MFYFVYEPFEVRVFYEEGFLCVSDRETKWCLPHEYFYNPKDIHALIKYHHEASNWLEIEL